MWDTIWIGADLATMTARGGPYGAIRDGAVGLVELEFVVAKSRGGRIKNRRNVVRLFIVDQLSQHIRKNEYCLRDLAFAVSERFLPRAHRCVVGTEYVRHRVDQEYALHLEVSLADCFHCAKHSGF